MQVPALSGLPLNRTDLEAVRLIRGPGEQAGTHFTCVFARPGTLAGTDTLTDERRSCVFQQSLQPPSLFCSPRRLRPVTVRAIMPPRTARPADSSPPSRAYLDGEIGLAGGCALDEDIDTFVYAFGSQNITMFGAGLRNLATNLESDDLYALGRSIERWGECLDVGQPTSVNFESSRHFHRQRHHPRRRGSAPIRGRGRRSLHRPCGRSCDRVSDGRLHCPGPCREHGTADP